MIDVEGSELDVLATLRQTRFYSAIEEIIIEVSEVNLGIAGRRQLMAMLAPDGYEELSPEGAESHYERATGGPRPPIDRSYCAGGS